MGSTNNPLTMTDAALAHATGNAEVVALVARLARGDDDASARRRLHELLIAIAEAPRGN